jgi:peptidoglycan hydrolase-like protein with peptidoglycan-binding domain
VKPPVKPPVAAEKPKPKPPAAKPEVTLSKVQPAKKNGDVKIVQEALKKEVGLQIAESAAGTFNAATKTAYLKFQKSLGYKGADADGIPGKASLTALGKKQGFTVKTP